MATSNQALVRDNSTLANFKQWAQAISNFFTTAGWVQSSDTGQVNWGSIASVPTSGNYVYEIWKPNDGLTTFYLRVEYGTGGSASNPRLRISLGTSTNGAGVLTGFVSQLFLMPNNDVTVSSTVTQWQCYFSGDSGRMGVMMWRDDTANAGPICFVVQRSLNSSGAPTSSYVTIVGFGNSGSCLVAQQSIVFGVGAGNAIAFGTGNANIFILKNAQGTTDLFNGSAPMSPVFPSVGYFDNPLDAIAVGCFSDFTEGTQYTIAAGNMPYGTSRTYIAGKNPPFGKAANQNVSATSTVLMRYD